MIGLVDEIQLRAVALSGLIALGIAWLVAERARRDGRVASLDPVWGAAVAAVVAGRLAWVVSTARPMLTQPIDLVRVQSGVDLAVAAAVFVGVALWRTRRAADDTPAVVAVVLLVVPAAFAALCVLRGDCYGVEAPPPFGVSFEGLSRHRLPIGLYEAAALVAAAALVSARRLPGVVAPFAALALLAVVQFAVEFGRVGQLSRFTGGWRYGWLILAAAAVAVAVHAALRARGATPPEP